MPDGTASVSDTPANRAKVRTILETRASSKHFREPFSSVQAMKVLRAPKQAFFRALNQGQFGTVGERRPYGRNRQWRLTVTNLVDWVVADPGRLADFLKLHDGTE